MNSAGDCSATAAAPRRRQSALIVVVAVATSPGAGCAARERPTMQPQPEGAVAYRVDLPESEGRHQVQRGQAATAEPWSRAVPYRGQRRPVARAVKVVQ